MWITQGQENRENKIYITKKLLSSDKCTCKLMETFRMLSKFLACRARQPHGQGLQNLSGYIRKQDTQNNYGRFRMGNAKRKLCNRDKTIVSICTNDHSNNNKITINRCTLQWNISHSVWKCHLVQINMKKMFSLESMKYLHELKKN